MLAQNKLQISTGQAAGFGEVLASLQAERDGIAAQLNGLQTDRSGYQRVFCLIRKRRPGGAGIPRSWMP